MKKMFEIIGMISLICVSFFVTEKTVGVVKEKDEIMQELREKKDTYTKEPMDAKIEGNTIVPGFHGSEVNVNKSYEKMKRYGSFLETLLEYQEISPNISLKNHYDKYVIKGNPKKNMVSLLFLVKEDTDIEPYLKKLEKTNTKVTFFLSEEWFQNNNEKVVELIKNNYEVGNLANYEGSSYVWMDTIIKRVGNQKQSYCYQEEENEDDLLICSANKDYTIMPTMKVKNYPTKEIKELLTSGSIISLPMNQTVLEELSTIIHMIESKGYQITTLEEHLTE